MLFRSLGVVLVLLLGVFVVRFGRLAEYAEGRVFIVAGRFRGVGVTGFFELLGFDDVELEFFGFLA